MKVLDGIHASSFLTAHPSVSAASSSNNSGRTYIQDILLDSFGHITGITTATETVVDTDTNYYLNSASFNTGDGVLTLGVTGYGNVTVDLDGRYQAAGSYLTAESDTLATVTTRGSSTTNNITIGALTVGGSLTYGSYTAESNYVTGADNILLKGNSVGVSGIFFESERDGSNINHPSDFGFIQYHAFGIGGSSGEANRLVIGVSNDADDIIVLNPVTSGGLVVRVGAGTTEYVVYHAGNIPTWNQNTSGNAATATLASTVTINYNNDSNSTYQLLWGSGNSVYGTAQVYLNPASDYVYAASFNANDWFRSSGNSGWYNSTYGGGIYQTESTMVRTYDGRGFWIDGGNTNTVQDATLYVTATNNNDWLAQFNAYNGSKTEYGVYVNIAAGATYGYALRTDSSSFTYRVDGSGRVYAPIYYDINDTAYYLNPASTSNLATVKLNSTASGTEVFTVDGVNGRLFTITDDLSDSLFSVNTIAGVPVIEAFSDYRVIMGRYNQNDFYIATTGEIGMGNTSVSGYKLAVTGNVRATSFVKTGGSSSQFLMADGSVSTNPGWITSYSETDTLATVTARGSSTSTAITLSGGSGTTPTIALDRNIATPSNYYSGLQLEVRATSGTAGIGLHRNGFSHVGIYHDSTDQLKFNMNSGTVIVPHNAGTVWGSGNLTNLNQLTNGPGYITSYSETDTFATVTARGNISNGAVTINGALTVGQGTSSDIYMTDTDETTRRIHCNSSRIGFLNSSSNWGAYNDNTGNWRTDFAMYSSDWFRSVGSTGWYSETYAGGIYMADSTWVRVYNNKQFLVENLIQSNTAMYAPIFYDSANSNYYLNPNGYSNLGTVRFNSSGSGAEVIVADGVNGRLFTITDDMTDSIFSVNTISGLPVIEAFADYKVVMGRYGQNDFHLDANGNIAMGATPVSGVKLFVSGKLSIGGSNSSYDLYNNGTSYFNGAVTVDDNLTMNGSIIITNSDIRSNATSNWTGDPGSQGKIQYHSNRWYIVSDSSSNRIVQFRRNGTDVSYIDNDGVFQGQATNVTINYNNDSNSTYQLLWGSGTSVYGTAGVYVNPSLDYVYATAFVSSKFGLQDGTPMDCYMEVGDDNPTEDGIGYGGVFRFYGDQSTNSSHLYFGGALIYNNLVVNGRITENSSIRYKKDIQQIENGLEKVLQLSGVTYTKINNEQKEAGVIAEEVAKILPEAVGFDTEGRPDSVSYGRLTALLIEAIKDLKKEIDELKGNK